MANVVVIAGASPDLFDGLSTVSSNLLAPFGIVVRKPLKKGVGIYPADYIGQLVKATAAEVLKFRESEKVSILLIYLRDGTDAERPLLEAFFPFSMPLAVDLPDGLQLSSSPTKAQINKLREAIVGAAQKLRSTSKIMSDRTSVRNLTPLILPIANFDSGHLISMLQTLFNDLGQTREPDKLIDEEVKRFRAQHPPIAAPGGGQHCYSDGKLFFKSPGRERHGFFRNASTHAHADDCILKARSRIGGAVEYTMHYDCMPVKSLRPNYPNCHADPTPPKKAHVNIGPSDFII